ncbi:MAG: hypothetical protein ACOZBW_03430 [Thermodesulfobacteriota bacterium]
MSKNGFNHGGTFFDLFVQIEIGIGSEIELNVRRVFKKYFFSFLYQCTFLGGKKSTKRTAPCGLACGVPRATAFFGAGRNSPACGGLKQPARFIPKKPLALGCAAKGENGH